MAAWRRDATIQRNTAVAASSYWETTASSGPGVDVSVCPSPHGLGNKIGRVVWAVADLVLFRPSPKVFHGWRRFVLRCFGARIGRGAHVYPSAKIWAPWNLAMGEYSCLSFGVKCYCVAPVTIGPHATVSQYCHLCTASHDIEDPHMGLVAAPIRIGAGAWLCAEVFVGPGVRIGEGAVVGARSSVFKDVAEWTINAGHPCRQLRKRRLRSRGDFRA